MKRFLVFGYDHYYPAGGANDLIANVDTLAEAFTIIRHSDLQCGHVLDTQTGKIES